MSEADLLISYATEKMSSLDREKFLVLYQYNMALFESGYGLPKIQAAWRLDHNLYN